MSFADRDYARRPARKLTDPIGFARMRMWSFTTWLIVINVAVFLLDMLLVHSGVAYVVGQELVRLRDGTERVRDVLAGPLEYWGEFSATTAIYHLQLWRFITFQFLHAGFEHIAFNMFALYIFGGLVERYFGSIRYLVFYLICGMAGPVSYMILMAGHYLVASPQTPLIGASAGIFGVLVAAAVIAPDAVVLIWGVVPAKLRHVAYFMIFLAVYTILFFGHDARHNAGGEAAHLGGAAIGYLLIRYPWLLDFVPAPGSKRNKRKAAGAQFARPADNTVDQREVDRILSKVATQGLDSLTDTEKRTLAHASKGK